MKTENICTSAVVALKEFLDADTGTNILQSPNHGILVCNGNIYISVCIGWLYSADDAISGSWFIALNVLTLKVIMLTVFLHLSIFSCLNFREWFLSLRVFGLLSSSLLLFPQRFGRYVLRASSGVCRTRKPTWNFELRPLLNPRRVACSDSVSHNRVQALSISVLLLACSQDWTCNLQMIVSFEV